MSLNCETKVKLNIYKVTKDGKKEKVYETEKKIEHKVTGDPTWSVQVCSAPVAILDIWKNYKGIYTYYLTDNKGETIVLSNTSLDVSVNNETRPTEAIITWKAEVNLDYDFCLYEILFEMDDKNGNPALGIYLKNTAGSGGGILLKANNTYIIEIVETIKCPDSVDVPAPSGTC